MKFNINISNALGSERGVQLYAVVVESRCVVNIEM